MENSELRRDPITGRWAIILMDEKIDFDKLLSSKSHRERSNEVKACQFCEGREDQTPSEIFALRHPNTEPNAPGWQVRVIPNKRPVLQIRGDIDNRAVGIYDVLNGIGAHELLIEHPQHFVNIPDFPLEQMKGVLSTMQNRIVELKKDPRFRYIIVHKNYGEASGTTLEHAYSHIIALPVTPGRVKNELMAAKEYYSFKQRCIFCDVVRQELEQKKRIVAEDGNFLAFTPFASRRPFEVWMLPEKHETFFEQNSNQGALASMLITVMGKIRQMLKNPDYIITLHSGPNINVSRRRGYWKTLKSDFHWHLEVVPLLRSYTSFELGSGFPINSVPPEIAARVLREESF